MVGSGRAGLGSGQVELGALGWVGVGRGLGWAWLWSVLVGRVGPGFGPVRVRPGFRLGRVGPCLGRAMLGLVGSGWVGPGFGSA